MGATEVLQVVLPSSVGLAGIVVTPVALYFQQQQQIKRDQELRRAEDARAESEAAAAEARERWELKRKVYSATVRALGHYRAEAAIFATALEQAVGSDLGRERPTSDLWLTPPKFPAKAFAQAQEAMADARLAAGRGGRDTVDRLDDALQASSGAIIPSRMTSREAWARWVALREAIDEFVDECADELDKD